MKTKLFFRSGKFMSALSSGVILFFSLFFVNAKSQQVAVLNTAAVTCKINIADKQYSLKPNNIGYFNRISGIKPLQVIPVEIKYPQGKPGDKIIIAVEDGGSLNDGKAVDVLQLDSNKKISFSFQAGKYSGIYHIRIKSGHDSKFVRFWVN